MDQKMEDSVKTVIVSTKARALPPLSSRFTRAVAVVPPPKKAVPPPVVRDCCDPGSAFCTLCDQKGRAAKTHCDQCCKYCAVCDKRGHNSHHPDGSVWCLALVVCDVCKTTGHDEAHCRCVWCKTCRTDGRGHNYVGHTDENCRKLHLCTKCNTMGHFEDRCRGVCEKCNRNTHSTDQCERDTLCTVCYKRGHSSKRCNACLLCGFPKPKKGDTSWSHKCKRDERTKECKNCGGVGVGKCACYDYVKK